MLVNAQADAQTVLWQLVHRRAKSVRSKPDISTGHHLQSTNQGNPMRALTYLCTAVILLAGCAATPKPTMPEGNYTFFAQKWAALHICGSAGQMPVELAAFGRAHIAGWASSWTFDVERMDRLSKAYAQAPSEQLCNQISMDAATWRQAVQNANAINATNQANMNSLVNQLNNFGKSNQVYCNSVGTQTICNKY